MSAPLKAPFPYFGGKSKVADEVWRRFGTIDNYVEPFFGSGAVLLSRPCVDLTNLPLETVNDADGMIANFWRALQSDPVAVAKYADWPVNEVDLHARHIWLTGERESITSRLEGNAEWYDARAAGWWVWGISSWIGGGFCSGDGPWVVHEGELVDSRQPPRLTGGQETPLLHYLRSLSDRLRHVRVCCGDFERVLTKSPTYHHGMTAVFLDPPYDTKAADRTDCYAVEGDGSTADRAREWAIANGDHPLLRIALCGYEGEHEMPSNWKIFRWRAHGGMSHIGNGRGKSNRYRERIWFSPHCLDPMPELFP